MGFSNMLQCTKMSAVVLLFLFSSSRAHADCFDLVGGEQIQEQFQWVQHATSDLSSSKIKEIDRILQVNKKSLDDDNCLIEQGMEPARLSGILSLIKLEILRLRVEAARGRVAEVRRAVGHLRQMAANSLSQPSLIARRLGASIRSLMIDELERLVSRMPHVVSEEIALGYWRTDYSDNIEKEIRLHWESLKAQMPKNPTPSSLARYFGARPWKPAMTYRSRLGRLLSSDDETDSENLETQLHFLFREHPHNVSMVESNKIVEHYLTQSMIQLKKNNYLVLKDWLGPIIDERLATLKGELGVSWPLVAPLVGVQLDGPFKEIDGAIELLDENKLKLAKVHYRRTHNPLGRLYEIVFLKRLTQMWAPVDISQVRADLNRVSFLKTLLAVQDYQKRFAKWPKSIDDLVKKKLLLKAPRDYFTGRLLKYDSEKKRIWSLGENGLDEKGQGDDMGLKLAL